MLFSPVHGLRLLTSAITLVLAGLLVATASLNIPAWIDFFLGVATGLSIGVQVLVWNSQLQWFDSKNADPLTGLNLNQQA